LAAVLGAVAVGLAMIYSGTKRSPVTHAWDDLVIKQLVFAGLGLALLALVSLTDYRVPVALWGWIYGGALIVLAGVLLAGASRFGGQRWVLASGSIQPSELVKLALIICLAAYCERFDVRRWRHVLGTLALTAVPAALVLLQPNLSTAMLLGLIWLGILFAAGIRPLHLSLLALLVAPALYVTLDSRLLAPYQLDRIAAWLNPEALAQHSGYQNIQTRIAVGNGGLTGIGFAHGTQSQGGWLPLPLTDNVFALAAEELGFLGAMTILALIAFTIWRMLRAAGLAQDRAGALIAAGVAAYLLGQTAINVAVVLQLVPVTGVSMPFVSYGGSSLVALLAAVGLVESVLVRRKPLEFH
jgi:rod shape determining protein RodA